jgi:rsbT antagonist protein RsbS
MTAGHGPIPILRIGSNLLASIQVDLGDRIAELFQEDVLAAIERTRARGLVLDLTGLEVVDSYVARILADTARMARLMGAETIVAGMRPEVAATLVRMGYPMDGVRTALDIDAALRVLGGRPVSARGKRRPGAP